MNQSNLSAFIWSVADLLRGDYKQSEYGKVILPFTVLRRLDCVLAPTKADVLKEQAKREAAGVDPHQFLLRKAGQSFYNTCPMDLKALLGDQDHIRQNLYAYIQGFSPTARDSNVLTATMTASYEIDFWGKNRAALRSAEQSAVAARFDREVVALSTVASAANAYFQMLAAQDRLQAARNNLTSANRVLELIRQRANAGTASALEIAQQESVVNTQRAAIPPLQQTVEANRNTIAVLMARSPESVRVKGGTLRAIAIPRVTPGLPSELLAQRPDIREAEANLAAANANVQVARAQMLPSISLTAQGGVQSAVLKTLLRPESTLYSIAGGLTQPIFDGGQLQGNLDFQKGRQDELLQNYRKAVISGFSDVETALSNVRQTAQAERLQAEVVASSRRAYDISEQRLREGTIDLVTVLQTQQTLFSAQDALTQARLAHVQAIVSLYQALGGGWSPKPRLAQDNQSQPQ